MDNGLAQLRCTGVRLLPSTRVSGRAGPLGARWACIALSWEAIYLGWAQLGMLCSGPATSDQGRFFLSGDSAILTFTPDKASVESCVELWPLALWGPAGKGSHPRATMNP